MIELARRGGFCFGVRRAIDAVNKELESPVKLPIATYGPLIHNPQELDRLAQKGVLIAQGLADVTEGTLIIRSHGARPDVFAYCQAHDIRLVDATCPCVKRIQEKARQTLQEGKTMIIIGEKDHPEIVGINGWCGDNAHIVYSAGEVERLPRMEKACVAAQTTTPQEVWDCLLPLIKDKAEEIEVFYSICNATQERQRDAQELARRVEAMVVIGGKNSSNTRKLYELCNLECAHTFSVERAGELDLATMKKFQRIGITSGASTPDWIIEEVIDTMSDIENQELGYQNEETAAPVPAQEPAAEQSPPQPAAESEGNFMEDYEKTLVTIRNGQIIKGTVVTVNDNEVCVNIGFKADGFLPKSELSANGDVSPREVVKIGDEIEVKVVKVNDGEGNVLLSRKDLQASINWTNLNDQVEAGQNRFVGKGIQAVKGGLVADINGVHAFVPASQLDTHFVAEISTYVGMEMPLKVIEMEKTRHRVVASRKQAMTEDSEISRKKAWENLNEGEKVKGVVRRITDFGAFVDIGGVDGLLHVTDMSWGRGLNPKDIVKVGDELELLLLKLDEERGRISLGLRQLQPKPWDVAHERYHEGSIVTGKVARIVPFGAFVELEPGLDGLIHISHVSAKRVDKVESVLTPGQTVDVKVLEIDGERKRISLSIREAERDMNAHEGDDSADFAPEDAYDLSGLDVEEAEEIEEIADAEEADSNSESEENE